MIYLDNAASTPVKDCVKAKINELLDVYGNPSSIHSAGLAAKKIITDANKTIATKANCNPEDIYYTSGATMSNNLIIQGFLRHYDDGALIISAIEHNDIIELAEYMKTKFHRKVEVVKSLNNGHISISDLRDKIELLVANGHKVLCSIQMANSETGIIQDMDEISQLIHSYDGCWLHTDATQYIPYYPIDMKGMNIDALSMSGQKIGCIKGIGLMIYRNFEIDPIIFGEQGVIGGTPNVIGIGCLAAAFDDLYNELILDELIHKRDYLIKLLDGCGKIIGETENRLPNNVCLQLNNVRGENLVALVDDFDICISAGSACSSGSNKPSRVLLAMGYTDIEASNTIRITISSNTSNEDIERTVNIIKLLIEVMT